MGCFIFKKREPVVCLYADENNNPGEKEKLMI